MDYEISVRGLAKYHGHGLCAMCGNPSVDLYCGIVCLSKHAVILEKWVPDALRELYPVPRMSRFGVHDGCIKS